MKLHEIGLFAKDPKASKEFYHDTLGLHLHHEEDGLSVFDGRWPGIEIGACSGYPDRVHISFIVEDVDKLAKRLREKGIQFAGPGRHSPRKPWHHARGSRQPSCLHTEPTEASPDWLKKMVE